MDLKYQIKLNLKNIPGKRIKGKYLAIECDDWGGIRMPSKDVLDLLLKSDIEVSDKWSRLDTLADKDDLEYLFDVLHSVKDRNGHPAVMTPVTNVANPDFKKIRESGFTQYFYEPFTETLKRYGRHPDTFKVWRQGMDMGIFMPESHGREHLTVQLWLKRLNEGDEKLRFAFDQGFASLYSRDLPPAYQCYRPEFYFNDPQQLDFLTDSIKDGVKLFRDIFGYTPNAFVPSNGIFHPSLEQSVAKAGVRFLYVGHMSYVPNGQGEMKPVYYRVGKMTDDGLIYYTRNCAFEPLDPAYKGIDLTLNQIAAAFRWGKPAIISSHRVNFIGAIDKENREKGLKEFKMLLKTIKQKWPDVQFVSLAELLALQYKDILSASE